MQKKLPDLGACSTVILGDIYEGEQQKKHLQWSVKGYISILWCNLRNMADLEYKDETICKELYDKMQWDRYDAIRDNKRFISVLDKIRKYC